MNSRLTENGQFTTFVAAMLQEIIASRYPLPTTATIHQPNSRLYIVVTQISYCDELARDAWICGGGGEGMGDALHTSL